MYVITEHSKKQVSKYKVELRLSSNPKKKIDVYKGDKKVEFESPMVNKKLIF